MNRRRRANVQWTLSLIRWYSLFSYPDALEDFVIANAPEFVRALERADEDLATGRARPASEIFAELGLMDPGPGMEVTVASS